VFRVEGTTDKTFAETVIRPLIEARYERIIVSEMSRVEKDVRKKLIYEFERFSSTVVILVDGNGRPCITASKNHARQAFGGYPVDDLVVVVESEIESYYLAGLSAEGAQQVSVTVSDKTSSVSKENLRKLMKCEHATPFLPLLYTLLEYFDVRLARQRNRSFDYLCTRLGI